MRMTVAELIVKLQHADPAATVYVEDGEYGPEFDVDVYAGTEDRWNWETSTKDQIPAVLITRYGGHDDKTRL